VSAHVTNQQTGVVTERAFRRRSSTAAMGKPALLSDDTDPDLVPRLRDSALLNAFAALVDELRTVMAKSRRAKTRTNRIALRDARNAPRK
jgi:hypothetical protein